MGGGGPVRGQLPPCVRRRSGGLLPVRGTELRQASPFPPRRAGPDFGARKTGAAAAFIVAAEFHPASPPAFPANLDREGSKM